MNDDDVSRWIVDLARGDETAAQRIWNRYCERLIHLARKKLGDSPRRTADEEDVVISAFHSFYRGLAAGRYSRLGDRHNLWKLLVTITARKAVAQLRREHAQKRGGAAVRGESVFLGNDSMCRRGGIGQVLGSEPTPELVTMVVENCEELLNRLDNESLRQVAVYKLEGYTNYEIAQRLECVVATVERKLQRIRTIWSREQSW